MTDQTKERVTIEGQHWVEPVSEPVNNWFMSLDNEKNILITHWCKGVETKEEVIEFAKQGMVGQMKPKGTNNEGTLWFNPAPEIEDVEHKSFGYYQCKACHHITDDTTKFTQMGDDT